MLSIVIVSFNAADHLRRCLESLYAYMNPPPEGEGRVREDAALEVIVVDNASADGSADMVAREYPQVRLLRNATNTGFAPAANRGAREAKGDVILFLNPDCVLHEDAFAAPAGYLRANPDVGALGIKVLDPDGGLQLSVRRFPGLEAALFNRYSLLTRLFPNNRRSRRYLMTDWAHNAIADVDWLSGACLMTTRAAIDRVGYFDEGYFWGFEDVDFCQRLHRAGLRVVYYPHTSVVHVIGASARSVPTKAIVARHRGMWRYYKRWLASNPALDAVVYAGIWARCGLQAGMSWLKRRL
jgi:GT2 family glycosyltransferase